MKSNREESKRRILGRALAKELSFEDMKKVTAGVGTISCSACMDDDCDERPEF